MPDRPAEPLAAASLELASMGQKPLPAAYAAEVAMLLAPGEQVAAWFEADLDERLHFGTAVLVATNRRLLARSGPAGTADGWQSWLLADIERLQAKEHGAVGTLELLGAERRLAVWRFTLGRVSLAHRFVQRVAALERGEAAETTESVCPSCGAVIPSDELECPACAPVPAPPSMSSLARLIHFARPRAGMALLGFALTLAATAAGMVPPYLTKPLIDDALTPRRFELVPWLLGGLALAAVVAWLLDWARTYVLAWVSERIAADLRIHTFAHLQNLSLEFFGGKRTGDLIARISSDTDRICYFLSVHLLDFGTDVVMVLMTAVILLREDAMLAAATLLPLPVIAWLVTVVRQHLGRGFAQGGRAWSEMTNILADTIPGVRVVKAFAQERREVERFRQANDDILKTNDRVNATWAFFWPLVALLTEGGLLVIWAIGAWQIAGNHASVGVLTMFLAFTGRFYVRLESMSRIVASTQRAAASAQRIFEILGRVPSVAEPTRPVHPGRLRGQLEFRNLGFKYGTRPVLQDVNLQVRPGEMIGLVGPSGAGKSTLVNLVCRFYDVTEGAILADGTDIRSFPTSEFRRNIGIVLQEPFLFYGTISENVAYGRPDATREDILAAAKAARAHEFILRLPDGYDSLVGERGQTLSGGERQRISIARALLIDPAILILDEATSSVDTETERQIQEALENLIRGRTTIAIAHRLSTLRRADRLVVLERGRIVEVGRHDELLERPGAYARLHKAQLELAQGAAR